MSKSLQVPSRNKKRFKQINVTVIKQRKRDMENKQTMSTRNKTKRILFKCSQFVASSFAMTLELVLTTCCRISQIGQKDFTTFFVVFITILKSQFYRSFNHLYKRNYLQHS